MTKDISLPFSNNVKAKYVRPKGDLAHENFELCKYAADFLVPDGTPVLAVKPGTVLILKDDSDIWGLDIKIANEVNYVAINHEDGTYCEYLHLGKGTVTVKVGEKVEIGQEIGKIGYSGCMLEPHLHLNAFIITPDHRPISINPDWLVKIVEYYSEE